MQTTFPTLPRHLLTERTGEIRKILNTGNERDLTYQPKQQVSSHAQSSKAQNSTLPSRMSYSENIEEGCDFSAGLFCITLLAVKVLST